MTSWDISFAPLLDIHIAVWGLVALFVFVAVMEWRRKIAQRTLRMAALLLAFTGLAGIVFRPHFQTTESVSGIMLLTKGYSAPKADSLLKLHPGLTIYKAPEATSFAKAIELPSFNALRGVSQRIHYVLGEGLPYYVFDDTSGFRYNYLPSKPGQGVQSISIPQEVKARRNSVVKGTVNSATLGAWLRWRGPEGAIDSVGLKIGEQPFTFGFLPKLPGRFVYNLELLDSAGTLLQSEKVPVVVAEERMLTVLFAAQFPTFELRYLKNLLAEQGHALSLRYQLSKGKYRYEFANQPDRPFARLTSTLLEEADLLFVDMASLESLSLPERSALDEAVKNGLGVVIGVGEGTVSRKVKEWMPFELVDQKPDTIQLSIAPNQLVRLDGAGVSFVTSAGLNSVWADRQVKPIAAYGYSGLGKISSALWQNSYRLMLKGDELAYANLWITLLDEVAQKAPACCEVAWVNAPPYYIDEPVHFTLMSALEEPPSVKYHGEIVPLKESWQVDNFWSGNIWPDRPGWDSLVIDGLSQPAYFFVNEASEWESVAAAQRTRNTEFAAGSPPAEAAEQVQVVKKPVSSLLFYLLLLTGLGGLWLAPKV